MVKKIVAVILTLVLIGGSYGYQRACAHRVDGEQYIKDGEGSERSRKEFQQPVREAVDDKDNGRENITRHIKGNDGYEDSDILPETGLGNVEGGINDGDTDIEVGGGEGSDRPEEVAEPTEGADGTDRMPIDGDGEAEGENQEPEELIYLGDWIITAYCPCEACCGTSTGITASGVPAVAGHTVACNSLPFGTRVMIDGVIYTVEDAGSTPYGAEWIDIYFDTHEEAMQWGEPIKEVYMIIESEERK